MNLAVQWNEAVRSVAQARADAMTGSALSRITRPLSAHERRKGQPKRNPRGADILDSLHYWRRVRMTCAHGATQYIAHVRDAMKPVQGLPA